MLGGNEVLDQTQVTNVKIGPWLAREGGVGDAPFKMERLAAKIERLEHQGEVVKHHVSELIDNAQQAGRLKSLAESLRNARELKIDELSRALKETKARIEQMQGGRSSPSDLKYRSFDAVDRRLLELDRLEAKVEAMQRNITLAFGALFGSAMMLVVSVAMRFY